MRVPRFALRSAVRDSRGVRGAGRGDRRIGRVIEVPVEPNRLIKKGDVVGVKESLVRSSEKGVMSFDTALFDLYKQGKVTLEEAISNADSRTNLEAKINFG